MPTGPENEPTPSPRLAPVQPSSTSSSSRLRSIGAQDDAGKLVYVLPNDYGSVSYYVTELLEARRGRIEPQERDELGLALRELLLNAIEHGNLRFGYREKSRSLDEGNWKQRVAERQRQREFANLQVEVTASWETDRVVITIRDEGSGFDWRHLPDPTDPDNLLVAHGRGVLMARLSVDSLRYNEEGNEVTIVKLLTGVSESQSVAG